MDNKRGRGGISREDERRSPNPNPKGSGKFH
jgi:hypothetical protein